VSAPDLSRGIAEQASLISGLVCAWKDFGYDDPPAPGCKTVPPLGERSASAIKAGHDAVGEIDELTRQLYRLREQLVGELFQDSDIRGARVDAMLARRWEEALLGPVGWQCPVCETEFLPSGEPVACPVCGPLHGPGAPYAQPQPVPWTLAADGSHWRTALPDGRTAVIRRKLGPDGEASVLFVPAVYESASDFVAGPECSSVTAAAHWVSEHVQVTR
jgi:hypothetical protein